MSQKSFEDVVLEAASMRRGIGELESALQELRGLNAWESDVERDTRLSIRLLYDELKAQRASLASFLATRIVETAS